MLCSYLFLILFFLVPQIWSFLLIWFQVYWLLLPSSCSGGKSVPVLFYFRYFIFRSKISYCLIEISFFTSLSINIIASLRSFSANYNIWVTSGLISCNHLFSWVLGHIFLLFICLVILDYILDIMNDVLQKLWILLCFCLFTKYAEPTLQTLSPLFGK